MTTFPSNPQTSRGRRSDRAPLGVILLRIGAILFCLAFWCCSFQIVRKVYSELTAETKVHYGEYNGFNTIEDYERAKYLHRYHGTLSSWYDVKTGKWYFERDGRKCELWHPEKKLNTKQ
jgi:hypothetical protein